MTRRELFAAVAGGCLTAETVNADLINSHADPFQDDPARTTQITLNTGEVIDVICMRAAISETRPVMLPYAGNKCGKVAWRRYTVTGLIANDIDGNAYWSEGGEYSESTWERC